MSSNILDAQLIERFRAGDASVAEALVRAHQPEVFRLALSILDDTAEAEEAAQDALVTALKALGRFRGEAAFSTWLYRITVNVCRGRLRQRRARERLQSVLNALFVVRRETPHPEAVAARHEREAALWRAINALDEKHRLPLVLHYYHDLSTHQSGAGGGGGDARAVPRPASHPRRRARAPGHRLLHRSRRPAPLGLSLAYGHSRV